MANSKVRISHNHPTKDFAPGVLNVVERSVLTNVNYYKLETFHSSPFYNEIVPLFIKDICSSESLARVYGHDSLRLEREGIVMINNHPLRSVRILANVVDYQERTLKGIDYYIFTLDDYTGCYIKAKIRICNIYVMDFRDEFVQIIGKVGYFGISKEINIESFRVIPSKDFHRELFLFWKDALKFHKILNVPWYQTPQTNNIPVVAQNSRQLNNRGIAMDKIGIFPEQEESTENFFIVDSQVYSKSSRGSFQDNKTDEEIIDSDEDIDTEAEDSTVSPFDTQEDFTFIKPTQPHSFKPESVTTESFTNITSNLFQDSTSTSIFIPLTQFNPSISHSWHQVAQTQIKTLIPLTPKQDLILTILKDTIRHLNNFIDLEDLLKNAKVSYKLNILINTGVVEEPGLSISNLRWEKLTNILNSLEPLIESRTNATNLLLFFPELETHLRILRNKKVCFQSGNFVQYYNANFSGCMISMEVEVLNHLIYWYLGAENDKASWWVNESLQWCYYDENFKEGSRVLKVRR